MSYESDFDPYYRWLGIRPEHQPPDHYRLLGLELFESDREVIRTAAERQAAHIQSYRIGPHSDHSQRLLNEIAQAKVCLLDPTRRRGYDASLRAKITPPPAPVVPPHIQMLPPRLANISRPHVSANNPLRATVVETPVAIAIRTRSLSSLPRNVYRRKRRSSWGPALAICFIAIVVSGICIVLLINSKHPAVKDSSLSRPPALQRK